MESNGEQIMILTIGTNNTTSRNFMLSAIINPLPFYDLLANLR